MNARHLEQNPGDNKLAARIASYELAARMQLSVPEISDLHRARAHPEKLRRGRHGQSDQGRLREELHSGPATHRARRAVSCSSSMARMPAAAS
jgi:hypothetical protein